MANRVSALADRTSAGLLGKPGEPGVCLREIAELQLWQIAAWPESLASVGDEIKTHIDAAAAPGPGQTAEGTEGIALRIEPLKWWVLNGSVPSFTPDLGVVLDLSHSRTHVRVSGADAAECLSRLLPLDLRDAEFKTGEVASSGIHHVGVTLYRNTDGYDLFIPRGFAVSVWELLLETAEQFGAEIL